jgi:hypothetical protein
MALWLQRQEAIILLQGYLGWLHPNEMRETRRTGVNNEEDNEDN